MIYKQKGDTPAYTIKKVTNLLAGVVGNDTLEFPVVVTRDSNAAYFEVWEVEEFDPEDLTIEITGDRGKQLVVGTLLPEE